MKHKNKRTMLEWWDLHPLLKLILCDANCWLIKHYNQELLFTQMFRSPYEQLYFFDHGISDYKSSVHSDYRGADTREIDPYEANDEICEYINEKYIYDPLRPNLHTVIHHGGTKKHLHWQVMYNVKW